MNKNQHEKKTNEKKNSELTGLTIRDSRYENLITK